MWCMILALAVIPLQTTEEEEVLFSVTGKDKAGANKSHLTSLNEPMSLCNPEWLHGILKRDIHFDDKVGTMIHLLRVNEV